MKRTLCIGLCLAVGFSAFANEMNTDIEKSTASDGILDSLEELRDLFEEHQADWIELALPGESTLFQDYGLVVPFRAKNLPEKFTKRLVGEYNSDGIPLYRITCVEDWETRRVLLFDSVNGTELWRLDADPFHDPYSFLRWKFGLSSYDSLKAIDPQEILRLDSAKIAGDFTLVPADFYEDYILAEEQRRLEEIAMAPAMRTMGAGEGSTNMVVGFSMDTNGLINLFLTPPLSGFGPYVEIFQKQNLIYPPDWSVAANRMPVTNGVETVWVDPVSHSTMFYIVGDTSAGFDDGDGYSEYRERYVEGSNPLVFDMRDTDGDGMHDWHETMLFGDLSQTGSGDFDGDGLANDQEMILHSNSVEVICDASLFDTDGDGMDDKFETIDHPFLDPLDPLDADYDYDYDGLSNGEEYQLGTAINNWDTDGDTLPDWIEVNWGTNPKVFDNIASDNDEDGLMLGDEYCYGTDPNNADSDGDGMSDGVEAAQGGNPSDDSDGGAAPPASDIVELKLTVGDHSVSRSEIYEMSVSGERTARLHSGSYGNVADKTFKFKRGKSYTVKLTHVGSSRTPPDYDYTAKVEVADGEPPGDAASGGIVIEDPNGILGIYNTSTYFFAAGKTAAVHIIKIDQIPLGGSTNLNKLIIGKVYVPTKWGGELTLSGGNVELFYTNGDDLDYDTAIKIFKGELDTSRVAQGTPCLHTVLENKPGWYYVKVATTSTTAISATFTQKGEAETTPWNGWYWPFVDGAGPNLYSETGSYTPLKDYDAVYGTTARAAEEAFSSGYTDTSEGHCWGWMLASIALPQPAATTTNGIVFNEDEMEGLYSELGDNIGGYGWEWKVGAPDNELPSGPPTAATGEALDAWTDDLHNAFREFIRQRKVPMIADLRAEGGGDSSDIWNHAIYKYESVMKQALGNDEKVIEVTTTITSNIDIPDMPSDSASRQDTYIYVLEYREDDGTIDGTSANQNWKSTTGFAPAHLGKVDVEKMIWQPSQHCGITKQKVDALY